MTAQGYEIEDLLKAKKQFELAAEIMDIAISEHQSGDTEIDSEYQKHLIQAHEVAEAGQELI